MAIFRKKQQESSYDEEDVSTASKTKSRPSVGKWICGSSASKQALKEDNKITEPPKASSSYASSTASSDEDKRDDRQNSFSRKSSARERQINAINDAYNDSVMVSIPPPAAQVAFSGRPRFDWIDVVSLFRAAGFESRLCWD